MTVTPDRVAHTAEIWWRKEEARLILGLPEETSPNAALDLMSSVEQALATLRPEVPEGFYA